MQTPFPTDEQIKQVAPKGLALSHYIYFRAEPRGLNLHNTNDRAIYDESGVLIHAVLRAELKINNKCLMTVWDRSTNTIHEGVRLCSANHQLLPSEERRYQFVWDNHSVSIEIDQIGFVWTHYRGQ